MEDFTKTKVAGANGELLGFSGLPDCKLLGFLGLPDCEKKDGNSLFSSPFSPSSSSSSSSTSLSSSRTNSENSRSASDSAFSFAESENESVNFLLKKNPVNLDCEGCDLKLDTGINNVCVYDLCDYSEKTFGSDSSVIIWSAINSFANHAQWKLFYCYMCDSKFLDAESHLEHMLFKHLPFKSTDNIILLPKSVQKSATRWSLDWKEPSLAWFKFMYDNEHNNSDCFTKRIETSECSDERTRLLKRIGESFDSLLSHNLSTDHLARLIERTTDYFIAGLRDEKLVVAREILDLTSQLPLGMLDENSLRLVLKQLKWLEGLFIQQSARMQACDEFKVQNDEFLHSISLNDSFTRLYFDPKKLSPEPEPPIRIQLPWKSTEMRENFSKVFEHTRSQIHLLNAKFERKKELLRNWDFVIILERMLFITSSRRLIESSLEEWRDRFSHMSSDEHNFRKNFISNVLQKSRQLEGSIEVIFRELKYLQILDELDVVDVEISHILAQLEKSEKELSLVCAFDYRMSFLPVLKCFIRANIKRKSHLTLVTENQPPKMALKTPLNQSPKMAIKTPVINNKVELGVDQTLAFWRSLTEEKKKKLFCVKPSSIYDYCYYKLQSPWLENEVFKATQFFIQHNKWRYFSCITCSRPFPSDETIIKHLATVHFSIPYWGWQFRAEPIGETRLAKVLLEMDWTPIDASSALNVFEEMSLLHECKDYAFMQWPTIKDDKRTKRLNLLKDHVHTLLQQKPSILSYTHLQTMIDLASEQAFSQLTPTKYRSIFNRLLRHSPVSFRFLDSKSLARFVVHFSITRKITKSYLESAYEGDSESEDYDSERETGVMEGGFKYKDTENDVFWKKRENIDAISFNSVGSFELDFKKVFPENDESLLLWVLDAPLDPKISKFPDKIILLLGLARKLRSQVVENQTEAHEMRALHYYIRHLEEYACFKRWIQVGSRLREKYNLFILKRYEEILRKTRLVVGNHKTQLKKHRGTKSALSCKLCPKNALGSFCYTCCVASVEMKKQYSISKQTQYHINSWQSIHRLKALEPLASRSIDLDYRVIILPLIRSLIRMKLEAWLNGGGGREFF